MRYHFVLVDYLAYYRSGELAAGDDAAEVRWVAPADLAGFELRPATQEMIGRALALVGVATASRKEDQ